MNALEHFEWNSNLIASVFQNCTWIRLSKVNFRIFPKWCMCCDVAGTLKQHQTDQQQAGCSFAVEITFPCTKACCTLSACSHSVQEAQLGKRWNCTYGGIKSSGSQWAFLWANLPPTVKRCRKHLQAHAFTATVIHMRLKMHKFESYFIHVAKANSNWWTCLYDLQFSIMNRSCSFREV